MADHDYQWASSLRAVISDCMHRNSLTEDEDRNFITYEDLKRAWNEPVEDSPSLTWLRRDLPCLESVSDERFCESWLRIISILIWIRHDNWADLVKKYWSSQSIADDRAAQFRDENIPFSKADLEYYMSINGQIDNEVVKLFFANQFVFNPVVLKEDVQLEFDHPNWRLPLTEEGGANDTGAYGLVTKVRVAKGYYYEIAKHSNGGTLSVYPEAFDAARKEFDVGYDFARESKNLQILRSSDIKHERIMQSFASVIVGQKFNLFFPWGDLDLDRFLRGTYLYEGQERSATPSNLVKEAFELLGALHFLHEWISHEGANVIFSHLDLKPNNILVTKDLHNDQFPVGKWKITDFGISSTEPRKDDVRRLVSARELYVRTNRTSAKTETVVDLERFPGPYQPPEAEADIASMFRDQGHQTPGDKSDIWSYGCIVLSVLAFALGGPRYTTILMDKCKAHDVCPDGVLRNGYFYRAGVNNTFLVNPEVKQWFEDNANIHASWFTQVWNIVSTKMLKIYPQDRKSARDITKMLKFPQDSQLPDTNMWEEALRVTDETPPAATEEPSQSHNQHIRNDDVASIPATELETSDGLNDSSTRNIDQRQEHPPNASIDHTSSNDGSDDDLTEDLSSYQEQNEISRSITREFEVGVPVALEVFDETGVMVSFEGSSILYHNNDRAKVFLTTEENGRLNFAPNEARTFPQSGETHWDQVHVAGHYIALHKRTARGSNGQIEIHDLNTADSNQQIRWTEMVQNGDVNAVCVSTCGFVAFRCSREIKVFDFCGESRLEAISPRALSNLADGGVKDVAFGGTGHVLIVVSSNHWFMQNLTDGSPTLMGRHAFRGQENSNFHPEIIPFPQAAGFILHDVATPGRCALIVPRPGTQSEFLEHHFDLSARPHAIAVTPDNTRVVYVTVNRPRFRTKRTYMLRSRLIDANGSVPVSNQDSRNTEMFTLRKDFPISIAAVDTSDGCVVLTALGNGHVQCFAID